LDSPPGVLVRFHGATKRYGERTALDGLDLDVHRGEVLGLLGANGAGKTTALRLLCGLTAPDAGSIEVDGRDATAEPLWARRRLTFVPDGAPLYANLSPRQHLELVGRLHGLPDDRIRSEGARLLGALALAERADDPVGRFSRGMRQKTALALALLPCPPLLVLDEPLSGLDAPSAAMIQSVLRRWADRGGAVLYTSHLLDIVEKVCDRMAILSRGRLVGLGTLAELRAQSGTDGSLQRVFAELARAEDPDRAADALLGELTPR
jgi:ABC-2 type transport system ATP-binding protein